jgi:hypothetical protein
VLASVAPRPPRSARKLDTGAVRPAQCRRGRRETRRATAERFAKLPLTRYILRYIQNVSVFTVPVYFTASFIRARAQLSSPGGPVGALYRAHWRPCPPSLEPNYPKLA